MPGPRSSLNFDLSNGEETSPMSRTLCFAVCWRECQYFQYLSCSSRFLSSLNTTMMTLWWEIRERRLTEVITIHSITSCLFKTIKSWLALLLLIAYMRVSTKAFLASWKHQRLLLWYGIFTESNVADALWIKCYKHYFFINIHSGLGISSGTDMNTQRNKY